MITFINNHPIAFTIIVIMLLFVLDNMVANIAKSLKK